jgi:prepilin peptidase CpaA
MIPTVPLTAALLAVALVCGVLLLAVAALHDVAVRTVPNWLSATVAVAGLGAQAAQGAVPGAALAAGAVFLAAGLCWRCGWMGGGDVKLLGAASLLVSPGGVPALLIATALSGGVLALPYLASRRRLAQPGAGRPAGLARRAMRAERWRLSRGGPIPYAVAIGFGAVFALSQQFVSTNGALP